MQYFYTQSMISQIMYLHKSPIVGKAIMLLCFIKISHLWTLHPKSQSTTTTKKLHPKKYDIIPKENMR